MGEDCPARMGILRLAYRAPSGLRWAPGATVSLRREEGEKLMTVGPIPEEQRRRFVEVLQEIDSPEALEWCRDAVEQRMAEVSEERARCLHKGDVVEVIEGPLTGNRGQVTARSCHAHDMVLVQFDELDLPEPLPIPATALRRLAA